MGFFAAMLLSAWGTGLMARQSRFSLETGAVTLLFAALIVAGDWAKPVEAVEGAPNGRRRPASVLFAGFIILILAIPPAALLLTNYGLEAPGLALPVEPMVSVPAQYAHSHSGTFILTSVLEEQCGMAATEENLVLLEQISALCDRPDAKAACG